MEKGRLIIGTILVLVGINLLMEQTGFARFFWFGEIVATFWPLVMIALGVSLLKSANKMVAYILIVLGVVFQTSELFDVSVWSLLWPLSLIFVGALILFKGSNNRIALREFNSNGQSGDTVLFQSKKDKWHGDLNQNREVTVLFSEYEIDLRDAVLQGDRSLQVTAVFAEVKIIVADSMRVVSSGDAILAEWNDSFTTATDESLPRLQISGTAVFASVEVVN